MQPQLLAERHRFPIAVGLGVLIIGLGIALSGGAIAFQMGFFVGLACAVLAAWARGEL